MRELYDRMLGAVAAQHERIREPLITAFWPMTGSATEEKLMLVGRAVNGWGAGFAPSALLDPEVRATTIECCQLGSTGKEGRDPVLWVTDAWGSSTTYNTKRSSFWCMARTAVGPERNSGVKDELAQQPRLDRVGLGWAILTGTRRGGPPGVESLCGPCRHAAAPRKAATSRSSRQTPGAEGEGALRG